jgi:hypothetical protein
MTETAINDPSSDPLMIVTLVQQLTLAEEQRHQNMLEDLKLKAECAGLLDSEKYEQAVREATCLHELKMQQLSPPVEAAEPRSVNVTTIDLSRPPGEIDCVGALTSVIRLLAWVMDRPDARELTMQELLYVTAKAVGMNHLHPEARRLVESLAAPIDNKPKPPRHLRPVD